MPKDSTSTSSKRKWLGLAEMAIWATVLVVFGPQAWERISPWLVEPSSDLESLDGRQAVPVDKRSMAFEGVTEGQALRLGEPPAVAYGETNWTDADRYFAELVDGEARVEYDPTLAHAARELAAVYARSGELATDGPFTFIMNSAGTADWGVKQALLLTTQEGDAPILNRLSGLLGSEDTSDRPARIGIGEAIQLKRPIRRSIAILISRSDLYLDPIPRELLPGLSVELTGTLPRGASALRALRMGPEGVMESLEATTSGERFALRIPAGIHRGVVWVELIATLEHGPTPLTQLGFYVGEKVPTEWLGPAREDESHLQDVTTAEDYAFMLLNRDRTHHGQNPLERREELNKVARSHCEDMLSDGFFGHDSPTTGTIRDRMNTEGIAFKRLGENLARNSSIGGAQEGLMFSLGHRKNCLSPSFDSVGVGVAMRELRGRKDWYLCQVFSAGPNP